MEPEIRECQGFRVAGLETPFIHILSPDMAGEDRVGKLWGTFGAARAEIPNQTDEAVCYGLVYGRPKDERSHPDELHYICANEVSGYEGLPERFVRFEVPTGLFAVFTHRGPISGIGATVAGIYRDWVPASDHEWFGECDVERYGADFDPCGAESVMEYRIPVRRRGSA